MTIRWLNPQTQCPFWVHADLIIFTLKACMHCDVGWFWGEFVKVVEYNWHVAIWLYVLEILSCCLQLAPLKNYQTELQVAPLFKEHIKKQKKLRWNGNWETRPQKRSHESLVFRDSWVMCFFITLILLSSSCMFLSHKLCLYSCTMFFVVGFMLQPSLVHMWGVCNPQGKSTWCLGTSPLS